MYATTTTTTTTHPSYTSPDHRPSETPLETLRETYTHLTRTHLPHLARQRSPAQPRWPIALDHCFARVILDNAVGIDRPWVEVVKAPATRNMDLAQLRAAVELGEAVARGDVDLVGLDERSLRLRGKQKGKGKGGVKGSGTGTGKRGVDAGIDVGAERGGDEGEGDAKKRKTRKGEVADLWAKYSATSPSSRQHQHQTQLPTPPQSLEFGATATTRTRTSPPAIPASSSASAADDETFDPSNKYNISNTSTRTMTTTTTEQQNLDAVRRKIANNPTLTPYRRLVLTLLTQVPRGRYTTYKALADAAAARSGGAAGAGKSEKESNKPTKPGKGGTGNARAVGGAMRNNPFAPAAPCHRVLASDGRIGGFGGECGAGVGVGSAGKVVGRGGGGGGTKSRFVTVLEQEEGKFIQQKRRLLREEGVRFDGTGKVIGTPFTGFV
ncbi:MAG: methylated-DNA--protein-cysteine methyltransferase [Alyxoria varia]|nr:MAG: methylated-DNA--protein-cysteine methyltransferase [Alyxoria varia]